MKWIVITSFSIFLLCLNACDSAGQMTQTKEEWVSLFNGKDLVGWEVKIAGNNVGIDKEDVFSVEEGILRVYGNKQDSDIKIGHMFYNKQYSYYRLKFEYRFEGKHFEDESVETQYGGVVFHSQSPHSMGIDQSYPVCLEFQLLGGLNTGDRPTGNVCTIGTILEIGGEMEPAHCIDSKSETYDGIQWIKAEILVLGDSIVTHIIDGDTVLQFEKPRIGGGFVSEEFDWTKGNVKNSEEWIEKEGTLLSMGFIGIQAHDPMEFRKVELLNLSGCTNPACKNYKSYYIQKDECICSTDPR